MDYKNILIPITPEALERARALAGVTTTLAVLATTVFLARVYVRVHPVWRLGCDDYLIVAGYIFVMVDYALFLTGVGWVFDPATHHGISFAGFTRVVKFTTLAKPFWVWSMTFIKISVAVMLLRFKGSTKWRTFLYAMVVCQLIVGIFTTIFQCIQCVPLSAAWTWPRPPGSKCFSNAVNGRAAYAVSSINTVTDVMFSLIPISFLRNIHRPFRERVFFGLLVALGLCASTASILKSVAISQFNTALATPGGDVTSACVDFDLWTVVEEQLGFLAACVPCLKSSLQAILVRLKIISLEPQNADWDVNSHYAEISAGYHTSTVITGPAVERPARTLGNYRVLGKRLAPCQPVSLKELNGSTISSSEELPDQPFYVSETSRIMCTTEVQLKEEDAASKDTRRVTPNMVWDPESDRYMVKAKKVCASQQSDRLPFPMPRLHKPSK